MARNSNDRPTEAPETVVEKSITLRVKLIEGAKDAHIVWEDGVLLIEDGMGGSATFAGGGAFEELRDALQAVWYEIPDEE